MPQRVARKPTLLKSKPAPSVALQTSTTLQERGEIRTQASNQASSKLEEAGVIDIGLTHKDIHEARLIRDAEVAEPAATPGEDNVTRELNAEELLSKGTFSNRVRSTSV